MQQTARATMKAGYLLVRMRAAALNALSDPRKTYTLQTRYRYRVAAG